MQSRDYLKKQYEQLGKVLASTVAHLLKLKYNTIETRQEAINNLDPDLQNLIYSDSDLFKSTIEKYPQDILQNLSLLIKEIEKLPSNTSDLASKIATIDRLLASKHKTINFNDFF